MTPNRVAIVTGGASGLGRAIAERFAADGARVVIADIAESAGHEVAERIGKTAMFRYLDVADEAGWARCIKATQDEFGPLTCLVNNAGISFAGSILNTTAAAWRHTFEVNATGAFLGCQVAVRAMRETGGTIINIASARGQRASGGQVAYCASKAAMLMLTESVAIACGEQGFDITCNAICPGVFDTPILEEVRTALGGAEQAHAALVRMHLLKRLGRTEEIAAMAAYLASDEARFVTGATFNVDGGFRIRDK
jgi:3alpha(or 20beta)-hydroxysteroid dehydrogenase